VKFRGSYFLDPFGCVKNQVDAETMMASLDGAGWSAAGDPARADLIIINSCGFIESAKQESINAVLAWRKRYPRKKIILAGCLAQRYAAELSESLPEADLLFGNRDLAGIAGAAAAAAGYPPEKSAAAPGPAEKENAGGRPLLSLPGSAYVKIGEGCNNRCAFCAIPLIRGGLRSRAVSAIADECRTLLGRGIRELCLIGQDTASFGLDRSPETAACFSELPALLEALSLLKGDFWIRLLYIHPDNFPPAILDIMEQDRRFLPYFDIPFQHGSEKILKAMNRRGNAETYLGLIEGIRGRLPDAVIRSTFMTGFPGETDADFEALLDFQERACLDWLGCFVFSREEGTPAYSMKGRVAKKTALERKGLLEERQTAITEKRMDRFAGRELDVLVEERFGAAGGEGPDTVYLGRLYCQAPEVDGAAVINSSRSLQPGTLVRGLVCRRLGFDLEIQA
jgi:ribosomal protein S12 methylthiotransferase